MNEHRPAASSKRVRDRALVEVRGCMRDWEDGRHTARELKSVAERIISPEYHGRVLIELLQNAHDAHPARFTDGRIEIVLDEAEGEHGMLYVANGGRPFGARNFTSLCSIGLSDKRPEEGIGHKGVGFKSVVQFSESPEVYSVARAGDRTFDGYRFRFALPADLDRFAEEVAPGRSDLAEYLRENLFRLKVPVPLDRTPEPVQRLGRGGRYVTVVRLPLRSAQARRAAAEQIRELMDDAAPFELFLERIGRVTLEIRSAGGSERKHYDRKVRTLYAYRDLKVQEVVLRRRRRLIMVRARVDPDLARTAIAVSVEDGTMRPDWAAWEKRAEVCVAVPVGEPLERGRPYTFLPMGEGAVAPLHGFVHAPFFAELNRRSFNETVPWNGLLLDTLAQACVRAALLADDGRADIPSGAVIDLMCWENGQLPRLDGACRGLGHDLDAVAFLPVLTSAALRPGRTDLLHGFLWETPEKSRILTPQVLAAAGVPNLLNPAVGASRLRRLRALADARRLSLTPQENRIVGWIEELAATAARWETFVPEWWADFYGDLAVRFPDGAVLMGKRIVLTASMALARAGATGVFMERSVMAASHLPQLPVQLEGDVCFFHEAVARAARRGSRRSAGRRWLHAQQLAHVYEPEAVLRAVVAVMGDDRRDESVRLQCLHYAYAATAVLPRARVLTGLRVPTRGGWRSARTAMFGLGWAGTDSVDETLSRLLDGAHGIADLEAAAERLLCPPEEICAGSEVSTQAMQRFLEQQGARHGLIPHYKNFSGNVRGENLNTPSWFRGLYCQGVPMAIGDFRRQWAATARRWPQRRRVAYDTVDYRPSTRELPVLPGQFDHTALDGEGRRLYAELIVHGLRTWSDSDLTMKFVRSSDMSGTSWPTPLAVFLAREPWIPQIPVGSDELEFVDAGTAWWWSGDGAPPTYLSVIPAALRRQDDPQLAERLQLLGIRFWNDPGTAHDRLSHLPALVRQQPHLRRGPWSYAVIREYQKAWAQFLPSHGAVDTLTARAPEALLTSRAGVLEHHEVTGTKDRPEDQVVYVLDPLGRQSHKLLQRVAVPVLPVDDPALGERVHSYLLACGADHAVRRAVEAEMDIRVGALPVERAPRRPLLDFTGDWLSTFVMAVVDLDEQRVSRRNAAELGGVKRQLERCDMTLGGERTIWIAGQPVDDLDESRCLLHPEPERPRLVVPDAAGTAKWRVVRMAADAIGTLIGAPYIAGNLGTALTELELRCPDMGEVTDGHMAAALDVPMHRLDAVTAGHAAQRSGAARLLPLLACVDLDRAEELQRRQGDLPDRGALRSWLTDRLDAEITHVLLELLDDDDRQRQLNALAVTLGDANRTWRSLGLPVVDQQARHHRQFAAWLQQNRGALCERVRDAHAAHHRAGRDLSDYVRLRALPGFAPDPRWHTTLWDLTPEILNAHADQWVATHVPPSPGGPVKLRPLAQVRDAALSAVHAQLPRLFTLVEEWCHARGRTPVPSPPAAAELIQLMDGEGLLDFEPPTRQTLIACLQRRGHWPPDMPATDRRADLGLARPGVAVPAQRTANRDETAGAAGPGVSASTATSADALREVALRTAAELTAEQLAVSPRPSNVPLAPPVPRQRGEAAQSGWSTDKGYRYTPPDQDITMAVGVAGEMAVAVWLEQHFGVPRGESWKSGLRSHVLPDGQGDDRLGYDFLVHKGDQSYLYEVKASVGASGEIMLGESEVSRASHLAPHETYFLVYVSNVFDADRRRITPLPNPFGAPGLAGYELVSTSMRLRFELPSRAD